MIDRTHALPLKRQAAVPKLSRSTVYYLPRPVPEADPAIVRRIDELHLDYPFAGSRMLRDMLNRHGIAISMDSRGSWRDNVFVQRLWRSVKYEEVYLRAHDSVAEASTSIGRYLAFFNGERPHSSLDRQTRDQAYFGNLPQSVAA